MSKIIRTRFAPSPTGDLHVGGARTAIYCWAFAKGCEGKFILRIEDTDQKRSSGEAALGFLDDLKWLGICWDEGPAFQNCGGGNVGPYYQSQRVGLYKEHLKRLLDSGRAYYAFETTEELQAERQKALKNKKPYRYNRASLELPKETIEQYLKEEKPYVVRFKVLDTAPLSFFDEVVGEVTIERNEIDDFIILKADGFPTYHFAVVVDDSLMKVTHVIRGQEHLNNTFKHLLLQDALEFDRPTYAHISLIFNQDGSKMSKRDKDKAIRKYVQENEIRSPDGDEAKWSEWLSSKENQLPANEASDLAQMFNIELPEINVEDFKSGGYLPEVLLNYLCLLGWSPGNDIEHFDAKFLVENFSLDRLVKSPAKFDRAKLLAFNLDALQKLSSDEFEMRLLEWCKSYAPEFAKLGDKFSIFASANHARSKTFRDAVVTSKFIIERDDELKWEDSKSVKKALFKGEVTGLSLLPYAKQALSEIEHWNANAIDECLHSCAKKHADGKLGKVAQPLRIAVAGGPISPPISDTLILLGKESTLLRIDRCLQYFASACDA